MQNTLLRKQAGSIILQYLRHLQTNLRAHLATDVDVQLVVIVLSGSQCAPSLFVRRMLVVLILLPTEYAMHSVLCIVHNVLNRALCFELNAGKYMSTIVTPFIPFLKIL